MTKINKLTLLLRSNQKLFHTQDLALLWKIDNRNTLYTSIKRLVKSGVLIPVVKGLYSTVPIEEIDKYQLGSFLIHRFCYLSCETVLFNEGVINQGIYAITYVSDMSAKISYNGLQFIYRKMKPEVLFSPDGIEEKDGYLVATKTRAISDMLYFNSKYHFDNL